VGGADQRADVVTPPGRAETAQLAILAVEIAQAVATAAPTFGASLAEIPIFQQLTRTIVGNLVQDAIFQLLDG